jgi:hypothetical protein
MQLASSKDDNDFNVQVKYIILGQKTTAAVWVQATNIVTLTYDNGSYKRIFIFYDPVINYDFV